MLRLGTATERQRNGGDARGSELHNSIAGAVSDLEDIDLVALCATFGLIRLAPSHHCMVMDNLGKLVTPCNPTSYLRCRPLDLLYSHTQPPLWENLIDVHIRR